MKASGSTSAASTRAVKGGLAHLPERAVAQEERDPLELAAARQRQVGPHLERSIAGPRDRGDADAKRRIDAVDHQRVLSQHAIVGRQRHGAHHLLARRMGESELGLERRPGAPRDPLAVEVELDHCDLGVDGQGVDGDLPGQQAAAGLRGRREDTDLGDAGERLVGAVVEVRFVVGVAGWDRGQVGGGRGGGSGRTRRAWR